MVVFCRYETCVVFLLIREQFVFPAAHWIWCSTDKRIWLSVVCCEKKNQRVWSRRYQ